MTVRRKEIKWSRPKYPPPWGIASFSKVAVHSAMEKNKIRLQCTTYIHTTKKLKMLTVFITSYKIHSACCNDEVNKK